MAAASGVPAPTVRVATSAGAMVLASPMSRRVASTKPPASGRWASSHTMRSTPASSTMPRRKSLTATAR